MTQPTKIIQLTDEFVRNFFAEHTTKAFKFHNLEHTYNVIHAAELLADKEHLSEEETKTVILAAYFHDLGYFLDIKNHEEVSKRIAKTFLEKQNMESRLISDVLKCIDATRMPQNPANSMERVICDADLYHLSRENFLENAMGLRKELHALGIRKMKKNEFLPFTLQFMQDHQYKTRFGKNRLETKKQQNIRLLEMEIEKMKKNQTKINKVKNQTCKEFSSKSSRELSSGISSMFRITGRMQINLSSIADSKSSLLISVNAIMISLIVSYILGKSNLNLMLVVPTLILLLTSLTTVILAILAARPTISSGEFTRKDIENKKVNLLFFGNFYKMSLEEYDWAIREMICDTDYLYGNMIRDQYSLGLVLAKKYQLLRWAFHVFMGGLILAVIAFIVMLFLMHIL